MRHTHLAKRLATTGLLAAGLAAPAAPALASAPALAATPGGEGSAYGLTVTGPVAVPPVPAVASRTGTVSKSLLRENRTGLVSASALDVKASAARASSTVARLAVPKAKLLASAVSAKCTAGRGSAHLAHAVLAAAGLDASPPPNTTVPVDVDGLGRTSLVLNKQQRTADGRLAVTAMELNLPGGKGAVRVASATCGRAKAPAEAPAPTPVEHDLPVTG
ncbi:choice-of-anchor P family protein [Actinomadura madurae]|uniref:choice-of-anchor P family protein n=1 Tax=Actinomadura madurae TaxID=1993 RepID=UPI0020D20563|nr:choice-of-anchor P family protein [Actinomadura madurae]MCQ0017280.1 choice-of-anchor P family protein [Actinomadura madurae]